MPRPPPLFEGPLTRLCALLSAPRTSDAEVAGRPGLHAAIFGNGASLEQINFLGNVARRGMAESYGLMVNYLYDLDRIEANHEAFVRQGQVAHSDAVWRADASRAATASAASARC